MNHTKSNYFILVLVLAVFASFTIACGGGQNPNGEETRQGSTEGKNGEGAKEGKGKEEKQAKIEPGVPVRTVSVQSGVISDGISSTSVIEAEQEVKIYPRVTGTVTIIDAEEGQTVANGGSLCRLEDPELILTESKSRAERDKLQRDLERTKTLLSKGIATETDLNNAQYTYEQAEISWRQAKTNLDYTQINSTINGVVFERLVKLGQKVDPSTQLFSLFNPKSLVINIFVPEGDYFGKVASKVKSISAVIGSESLPGKEFSGRIKRVSPVVDPSTNTIKITLTYQDPAKILRPGMYVRVRLITDTRENAVLIPKTAILFDNNQQYTFIVKNGKAVRVNLKEGFSDAQYVESLEGIAPGDQIVVVGQNGLKTGSKVRVVNDDEKLEAAPENTPEEPEV